MRTHSRTLIVLCVVIFAATMTGCGQNIFKGLAGTATRTASEELKAGNYDAAISGADTVINSGATGDALQTAYSVKGTAILMKYQSLPYHLFQTIIDLSDQTNANIVTTFMSAIPIDYENAILAANALNAANTLSSTTNLTVSSVGSLAPSLNSTAQLNRAFANTTVVIKMLTRYLDIGADGSVSKNTLAVSEELTMGTIIEYLTQPPKTVTYYAEAAVNAGTVSGIFTDDQLVILNRISMLSKNLNQLRDIVDNGNSGTFALVDQTDTVLSEYPTISISSGNQESAYIDALEQIISVMKTGALE